MACNRHDRKAETAFPPTIQQRLSSRFISAGSVADRKVNNEGGQAKIPTGCEGRVPAPGREALGQVMSCSPESMRNRGGEGAMGVKEHQVNRRGSGN